MSLSVYAPQDSTGVHYDLLSSDKLWHDDVRMPPRCHECRGEGTVDYGMADSMGGPLREQCDFCGGWGTDWIWARTNDQAKEYLITGRITMISMDHDLGGHELDPNDPSVLYYKGDAEETGLTLVDWMIENDCVPAVVIVHSWNAPGAERMMKTLKSARVRLTSNDFSIHRQPYEVPS